VDQVDKALEKSGCDQTGKKNKRRSVVWKFCWTIWLRCRGWKMGF